MTACEPTTNACHQATRCARCGADGEPIDASVSLNTMRWCPVFIDRRWRRETMQLGRPLSKPAKAAHDLICASGAQGISTRELRAATHHADYETARKACINGVRLGRIWNLRSRRLTVYFGPGVDRAEAERTFAVRVAQRDAEQAVLAAATKGRYESRKRAEAAAIRRADKAGAERLRKERIAAVAADRRKRQEERKAKQERRNAGRESSRLQRDTAVNNKLAAMAKGKFAGIVPGVEPPPVVVDFSRAKVTVAPRKLGRYEVLDAPGPFGSTKPGQYVFPAQSCAARVAA